MSRLTTGKILTVEKIKLAISRDPKTLYIAKRYFEVKSPPPEGAISPLSRPYFQSQYISWKKNPHSVKGTWRAFFESVEEHPINDIKRLQGASITNTANKAMSDIEKHLKIPMLIRNYQALGHQIADLDPLKMHAAEKVQNAPVELLPAFYGFTDADMDKEFTFPAITSIGGKDKKLKLREIIQRLKTVYCSHIGVEYTHLASFEEREWVRAHIESGSTALSNEEKKILFQRLVESAKFEDFLNRKWPSVKRFGLEGGDVMIPALKRIIDASSNAGVNSVVIGMAHRGRLNVFANVCRPPLENVLCQFSPVRPDIPDAAGDVKYHLGICVNRMNRTTKRPIKIAVIANPSHLEVVHSVTLGKVLGEAFQSGDSEGDHTLGILIHGDAAVAGQGIVSELLNLSNITGYSTHGTIHVVVNNQVGFTADPRETRSSLYCTDLTRAFGCPVFHVNGDCPEDVMRVCDIAAEWRRTFKKDVAVDLMCYRRHGHTEEDEPMFTQPLLYRKIKKLKPLLDLYTEQIVREGVMSASEAKNEIKKYNDKLEKAYEKSKTIKSLRMSDWLDSPWHGFFKNRDPFKVGETGVSKEVIHKIVEKCSTPPQDFNMHGGLKRVLSGRKKMEQDNSFDWAMGEAIAFGSLLLEGVHVRLSGEDVERGPFSQRHHVLHDQKVDHKTYIALNDLSNTQAQYTVYNSPLTEYAVLGLELGYSAVNPMSLVIWEAQFGDFANVAQCVIDQFISSGQKKWVKQSGLVLSLPHGLEGMGPEHSSARLERFLQMCDDDYDQLKPYGPKYEVQQLYDTNWIVTDCTTPANLFHLLRRQIALSFRKPLVMMSPKSLLRHPLARSPIEDFLKGTKFHRFIPDKGPAASSPDNVKRLILCTGKVYYELLTAREQRKLTDKIAISRIEQLNPFPYDMVEQECKKYSKAELVWAQEEHKNMGAWTFVHPRAEQVIKDSRELKYVGRKVSASPATGFKVEHDAETKSLLDTATTI